jgi:hypothetical protein
MITAMVWEVFARFQGREVVVCKRLEFGRKFCVKDSLGSYQDCGIQNQETKDHQRE